MSQVGCNEAKFDMPVNKNCHEQQTKRDVTFIHYGVTLVSQLPAYPCSCDEAISEEFTYRDYGGNLKHIAHVLD